MSSKQTLRKKGEADCHLEFIHDFFDSYAIASASSYLRSACKAAKSNHISNKHPPVDLLFLFDSLERLLYADYAVVKKNKRSSKALI